MTCRYCGARNPEDEHRCSRCGRRVGEPLPPVVRSSAVPAPEKHPPRIIEMPRRGASPPGSPEQQDLFRTGPSDGLAPARPEEGRKARRPPPQRSAGRIADPNQRNLPFAVPAPPGAKTAALLDGRVAPLRSRVRAGAFDGAMVVLGALFFLAIPMYRLGGLPFNRQTAWAAGAVVLLVLCVYKLSFLLLSDRSPGMRLAGLSLQHFKGRPPTFRERLVRELASILSLALCGIGYLWALVDPERLTFHDHISETFPSLDGQSR